MTTTNIFSRISSSSSFNGTDTVAVLRAQEGTVIGYRLWTDARTGVTRAFHILTYGEAETYVHSLALDVNIWSAHALGLAAARAA